MNLYKDGQHFCGVIKCEEGHLRQLSPAPGTTESFGINRLLYLTLPTNPQSMMDSQWTIGEWGKEQTTIVIQRVSAEEPFFVAECVRSLRSSDLRAVRRIFGGSDSGAARQTSNAERPTSNVQ